MSWRSGPPGHAASGDLRSEGVLRCSGARLRLLGIGPVDAKRQRSAFGSVTTTSVRRAAWWQLGCGDTRGSRLAFGSGSGRVGVARREVALEVGRCCPGTRKRTGPPGELSAQTPEIRVSSGWPGAFLRNAAQHTSGSATAPLSPEKIARQPSADGPRLITSNVGSVIVNLHLSALRVDLCQWPRREGCPQARRMGPAALKDLWRLWPCSVRRQGRESWSLHEWAVWCLLPERDHPLLTGAREE